MNIYPSSNKHNDIILVGFGLSNTLLALSLLIKGCKKKILIIEKSLNVDENKIWCFWDNDIIPNYIKEIVDHQWSDWSVSYKEKTTYQKSKKNNQYLGIKSKTFFDFAKNYFHRHENINIIYDTNIENIIEEGELIKVQCENQIFSTRYCFDSRYKKPKEKELSQDFFGLWVETDQSILDQNIAGLMLDLQFQNGISFDYILPVSKNKFLIEFTRFTKDEFDLEDLESQAYDSIKKHLKHHSFKVVGKENGSLPLNPFKRKKSLGNIKYSGITSGNIRGSTGYSFLINCRWAESMSEQLINQQNKDFDPIPFPYRFLDSIFLDVISDARNNGPEIFYLFFEKNLSKDVSDFLSERKSIFLISRIILNMPRKLIFLKFFLKKIFKR